MKMRNEANNQVEPVHARHIYTNSCNSFLKNACLSTGRQSLL